MTTLPVIDPPRRPSADCAEYHGYRPGDECPRHQDNGWAICGNCETHTSIGWGSVPAIRVWGYRDPEPSVLDGVMTSGPEWWCPECVASFELSRDIVRCTDCGDAYHPDMECVHGGICDGCREKEN